MVGTCAGMGTNEWDVCACGFRCLRGRLGWLRRRWRPGGNLEWSGSQICAVVS